MDLNPRKNMNRLFILLGLLLFVGSGELAAQMTAKSPLAPTSDATELNINDWSIYADQESSTYFIDFEQLAVNVNKIMVKNTDGQVLWQEDVFDLPVNSIYELDFSSFNAAIGAKIVLAEPVDLRINLASGFRAPNLAELTSNGEHEGTNRYEVGDPNLENEQNVQLDVSAGFRNKHVEIFGSGFYNLVNNYIFIEPTGMMIEDSFVFNYKQNDAYLYGGEFGLHLHPHPLDWLNLESSFESVVGRLKNVESDLPLIPANTVSNTFRVEFEDGSLRKQTYVFLGMRNTLKQSNISEFETPTPGYTLFNTGVGGTLQFEQLQLDLGLSVTNLFNTTYIAHLSRLKVDGIPNMGRNLKLSVKATL